MIRAFRVFGVVTTVSIGIFGTAAAALGQQQLPLREILDALRQMQQMPPPTTGSTVPVPQSGPPAGSPPRSPISSSKPTIDCSKSPRPLAAILCSSEDAAKTDWDVNASAWAYAFSLDGPDRKAFWQEQDAWVASVTTSCKLSAATSASKRQCVVNTYQTRAKTLQAKLTGDALTETKLTPEQRAEIQGRLISLGFLSGDPDGEFGPNTRSAIRKFQQANGLELSNYLTPRQREMLVSPSGVSSSAPGADALRDNGANPMPAAETRLREQQELKKAETENAKENALSNDCMTALDNSRAVRNAAGSAKSVMIRALTNQGFLRAVRQAGEQLNGEPVLPSDVENPTQAGYRIFQKFSRKLHDILGNDVYGRYNVEVSWLGEFPLSCLPGLREAMKDFTDRLKTAFEERLEKQRIAQQQEQERQAKRYADLEASGYRRVSVETFLLDGRELASDHAKVALEGVYAREGNLDVIYASRRALMMARRSSAPLLRVPMLTEGASRSVRQNILRCQGNPTLLELGCENAAVKGHATMCSVWNAFGVTHKEACMDVEDAW
jgi:peptidoglycan hydrolase-like protein with peptidoglycan-binding domain